MKTPAPGPYEVVTVIDEEGKARGKNGEQWILIRNETGAIATVYPARDAEATARLLAASWRLLEAAKIAVQNCNCTVRQRDSGHLLECFAPDLKNAIAHAEGEPILTPPGRTEESPTKPQESMEAKPKNIILDGDYGDSR
jgi:hypothetical protein